MQRLTQERRKNVFQSVFFRTLETMVDEANAFIQDKHGLKIDYGHKPERFSIRNQTEIDRAIEHLAEEGYAVFTDLMDNDEVEQHRNRLWTFLESIPNLHIERNNPNTWHQWFDHLISAIF